MNYEFYKNIDNKNEDKDLLSNIGKNYVMDTYMDFYEKNKFFSQTFINTKEELSSKLFSLLKRNDLLFRGVNEAKYKLYNSMQRFLYSDYMDMHFTYNDLLNKLFEVFETISDGTLKYLLEKNDATNGLNALSCFSYLQHYGCPTPFLDWTYNLKSAMYFATDNINSENIKNNKNSINNYISIYVMHKEMSEYFSFQNDILKALNKLNITSNYVNIIDIVNKELLEDKIDSAIITEAKEIINNRKKMRFVNSSINKFLSINTLLKYKILFISDKNISKYIKISISNNMNILNQEGAFLFNSHPFAPLEWVINKYYPMSSIDNEPKLFFSINIHKSLVNEIYSYLESENYCKNKIYPDPYELSRQVILCALTQLKE